MKIKVAVSAFLSVFTLICLCSTSALAVETYDLAEVKIGTTPLFSVTDTSTGVTAKARAAHIENEIEKVLRDPSKNPTRIDVKIINGHQVAAIDDFVITTVDPRDVAIFNKSESELGLEWATALRTRLTQLKPIYTAEHAGPQKDESNTKQKPLSEHRVLLFLAQVTVLLLSACLWGEALGRLGQPAVIGQMLAGIILGPTVIGTITPSFHRMLFPVENTQGYLLDIVSWLGVIFLMMLTGTETDINLIKSQGKRAVALTIGGILFPFLSGLAIGYTLPESMLVLPQQRMVLALFLGTVFSISSVAVIAKVLIDMKLMRRNVGQLILASALAQDVAGCTLLAFVAAMVSQSGNMAELAKVPIGMFLFVLFCATVGKKWILNGLRFVHDRVQLPYATISYVAIVLLFCSAITQFIGVHAILGAFAAGVILAQSPLLGEKILEPLEAITFGIFAPIFFAAAGLHVNLTTLKDPEIFGMALLVTAAACASKIGGSYLAGTIIGMNAWESLSVGFGTNARGAMGLIVGILGFSLGLLTVNMFSIIVVMSLATTAMAPFLLRWSLKKIQADTAEMERLEREEKQAKSFITKIRRVLLPVKRGSNKQLSSRLMVALGQHHPIETTSFTVLPENENMEAYLSETLATRSKEGNVTLVNRTALSNNPAKAILEEINLNYDLVILESNALKISQKASFGPIVDEVARSSESPLLIVYESRKSSDWNLKQILIPTTGIELTTKAAELGILIAKGAGAKVTALHVIEDKGPIGSVTEKAQRNEINAHDIVAQAATLAGAFQVEVDTLISNSDDAADEIIKVAKQTGADLIVVAASVRSTQQLNLGRTVRRLIAQSPCHIAILSS